MVLSYNLYPLSKAKTFLFFSSNTYVLNMNNCGKIYCLKIILKVAKSAMFDNV